MTVSSLTIPPATITTTGPAEVAEDSNTNLLLLQCRYLHESGCKSSCLNLCQQPTQTFFNEVLGESSIYILSSNKITLTIQRDP